MVIIIITELMPVSLEECSISQYGFISILPFPVPRKMANLSGSSVIDVDMSRLIKLQVNDTVSPMERDPLGVCERCCSGVDIEVNCVV